MLETNPYQSPKSSVNKEAEFFVPKEIHTKIRNGWIAAVISAIMTFIVMLIALNKQIYSEFIDIWTTVDIVLILLLAFGIYKKSRTATTIMFLYFLLSKIWFIAETGRFNGVLISILFLYFYFNAMTASFAYHKLLREINNS